jgi:hypothetical protein
MVPCSSSHATAVPNDFQVRLEIVKAMRALAEDQQEWLWQRQTEIASLRREWEEITRDFCNVRREWLILARSELWKYGYNPEEPRIPKRHAGGGEWTRVAASDDADEASDAPKFQPYAEGRHWVPEAVFNKFNLRKDTREVFENATSGPLADASVNRFTREHRIYNDAVEKALREFLAENGISEGQMTPEQAEIFCRRIRWSSDPVIGGFNRRIIRQRLRYIEFFYLRGGGEED